MKSITKLIAILIASAVLFACDGGGSSVKTVKVWRLVEEVKLSGNDSEKTINKYKNGMIIKKEFIDAGTGLVKEYEEYTYKNDVIAKIEKFTAGANPKSFEVTTTDDEGTVKLFDAGAIIHTYKNTYDSNKQLLKRELYRSLGSLAVDQYINYTYDDNIVVVLIIYRGSKYNVWTKFIYDDKGYLKSRELREDSSTGRLLAKYDFEYIDENGDGNIDKQTMRRNGTIRWTKNYNWKEFSIPEKYATQTQKGCRVKLGGCAEGRPLRDYTGLPMMFYKK